MNLLKKGIFAFLIVSLAFACSKDEPVAPVAETITGLTITAVASGDGTVVTVTPKATGATKYSVDFGTDATDDVKETSGPAVMYDYPNETKTYTIKATASSTGKVDVSETQDFMVTYIAPPAKTTLFDFETAPLHYKGGDGIVVTIEAGNAATTGTNTTKVLKAVADENDWKATLLYAAKRIDLSDSAERVITLDYYQPDAVSRTVGVKFEDGYDAAGTAIPGKMEVSVVTAATKGWQTLTFDFATAVASGDAAGSDVQALLKGQFNYMVIFPSFGAGDKSIAGTYYFDNIKGAKLGVDVPLTDKDKDGIIDIKDKCPDVAGIATMEGCPDPGTIVKKEFGTIDFESFDAMVTPINDFNGGNLTVIDNPDKTNAKNTSNKVLQMVKNAGETWGGSYITLENAIDMSSKKKKISIKVKKPASRTGAVLLKLENLTTDTEYVESTQTVTGSDWETLTFDFSAATGTYQKLVFIFDNGTNGAGGADWTFLIDDIKQID